MAESLYDAAAQRAREEFYRLVSVNVSIATDEQLAKMRDSNKDAQPRAQMVVTWEPLSYRKEGGKYGNIETDYYPMSSGVSDEEIEQIRFGFWRGIPENKRMRIPQNLGQATRPWQRFMLKAKNAGLRIDIGEDGQFTSPDIGRVFKVEAGFDSFPQWQPNATGRGGRWTNRTRVSLRLRSTCATRWRRRMTTSSPTMSRCGSSSRLTTGTRPPL